MVLKSNDTGASLKRGLAAKSVSGKGIVKKIFDFVTFHVPNVTVAASA